MDQFIPAILRGGGGWGRGWGGGGNRVSVKFIRLPGCYIGRYCLLLERERGNVTPKNRLTGLHGCVT